HRGRSDCLYTRLAFKAIRTSRSPQARGWDKKRCGSASISFRKHGRQDEHWSQKRGWITGSRSDKFLRAQRFQRRTPYSRVALTARRNACLFTLFAKLNQSGRSQSLYFHTASLIIE